MQPARYDEGRNIRINLGRFLVCLKITEMHLKQQRLEWADSGALMPGSVISEELLVHESVTLETQRSNRLTEKWETIRKHCKLILIRM